MLVSLKSTKDYDFTFHLHAHKFQLGVKLLANSFFFIILLTLKVKSKTLARHPFEELLNTKVQKECILYDLEVYTWKKRSMLLGS